MNTTRSDVVAASSDSLPPRRKPLILPPSGKRSLLASLLIAKLILSVVGFSALFTLNNLVQSSSERLSVWQMESMLRSGSFDLWSKLLTFVLMIGVPVSAGLLLEAIRWLHMVYSNLRPLGRIPRFDTRWAILGFLIPGLNLFRPYQIAQEVWMKSGPRGRADRSLLLLLAWATWLANGVFWITLAFLNSTMPAEEIQFLFLAQQILVAVACALTLIAIEDIQQRQRVQSLDSSPMAPVSPTQVLGPYLGIQVAVCGLAGAILLTWAAAFMGWGRTLVPIFATQAALLLAATTIFQHRDWHWPRDRPKWSPGWAITGSVVIGAGLSLTWASLILHQFPSLLEASEWTRRLKGVEQMAFLALVVLVAPMVEELVFRGAILHSFRREWTRGPAILLSSLIFACLHFHPVTMMLAFMVGCLCATVRLATNSLVPAMVLHAVYNLGITVLLSGERPGEWISAEVAWRGALWVALGLLLAGGSSRATAGSRTARAVSLIAAATALVLAALHAWNSGNPEWGLVPALGTACWLALAIAVARQNRGAAVLLAVFHLANSSLSVVDLTAAGLFLATAGLLLALRRPMAGNKPAADSGSGLAVTDPRWWWGEWGAPLAQRGDQIPRLAAETVDTYVDQAQSGARALGDRLAQTSRQGVGAAQRDLASGALADRLIWIFLALDLAIVGWGLVTSLRLFHYRSFYVANRAMGGLAQHLEQVDWVACVGLALLFPAFLAWLGRARQKLAERQLASDESGAVLSWRGLVFPLRFFSRPGQLLEDVWTASQPVERQLDSAHRPPNLRAMLGLLLFLLLISLPVQSLLSSLGLDGPAGLLAKLRLSPLGFGLWLLLLVRLAFFVRAVSRGARP